MSTGTASQVKEHMDVICSQGMKMGKVDHVEGNRIKLTKNDSPDGKHHYVPTSMIDHVDAHVHLSKPCDEIKAMPDWAAE